MTKSTQFWTCACVSSTVCRHTHHRKPTETVRKDTYAAVVSRPKSVHCCDFPGCKYTGGTIQGLELHRRRVHEVITSVKDHCLSCLTVLCCVAYCTSKSVWLPSFTYYMRPYCHITQTWLITTYLRKWHYSLPPWWTTVRRQPLLYLASISWWWLIGKVADVNNGHQVVNDVTGTTCDVIRVSSTSTDKLSQMACSTCRCL